MSATKRAGDDWPDVTSQKRIKEKGGKRKANGTWAWRNPNPKLNLRAGNDGEMVSQ